MTKEVILTPIAVSDFENVIDYLTLKWGILATNNFIERFDKVTLMLAGNAAIFPFFDTVKQLQRCVLLLILFHLTLIICFTCFILFHPHGETKQ